MRMREEGIANLRFGHQRSVSIAQRTVRQAELLLVVALAEELLEQQVRPVPVERPRLARVRHVAAVQHQREYL